MKGGVKMNYELVMLRGIPYCKKTAQRLQKQCLSTALRSFSSSQAKGGTLGQMTEVAELARMRDDFLYFLSCVKSALTALPDSFRALLVEIYIKNTSKEHICQTYGVSMSTLYRKLARARECFKGKLEFLGCDEQWFESTYGDTDWVRKLLDKQHNGSRIAL